MTKSQKHSILKGVFWVLQLAFVPLVLWWTPYSHLPPPGWAVAIVAGAAAAMSIHEDIKGWQKGIWMLIIGAFLVIELRAINKDRADNNARALNDSRAQELAFKNVRDAQDSDFKATAEGLTSAISGIKETLGSSNTTLRQTHPHASLRFDKLGFYPSAPSEIKSETPYQFNYFYLNGGTETATNVDMMARIYVADADDKKAQSNIAARFEQEWGDKKARLETVIVPNESLFQTIKRTFSVDEMKDFDRKQTIYFLLRFEYTDTTGRWRTDACEDFQRTAEGLDTSVTHVCVTFVKDRYSVRTSSLIP